MDILTRDIEEAWSLEEAIGSSEIDDANGVIKNVVLLTGLKATANRTFYTDTALEEASKRYEGAKMFIDHPTVKDAPRSINDFGGIYRNVRRDGAQIRGDLHLVENKRAMVVNIAKMRPSGVGLSIKDKGRGYEKDGTFFVEGFSPKTSYSVDFVSEASANKDLFEGVLPHGSTKSNEGGEKMDYKEITLDVLKKERPDLIESIQTDSKTPVLKELDEAKGKGADSEALAGKYAALLEADFTKDVRESVRKMIEPKAITIEAAKAVIAGQKELIESLTKGKGEPEVKGAGHRQEDKSGDLPKEAEIIEAFKGGK